MLIEILLAILIGVMFGTISGLIPGIHVNLVAAILLGSSAFLLEYIPVEFLIVFIVSMAITHTFLDTIPSIFLGAPDGATALSVLPGHRLLLEGKGLEAVYLTVIGSLGGLLISLIGYLLFEQILGYVYPLIRTYIGEMLIFVSFFMIYTSKEKFRTILLFSFSGVLGLIALNSTMENALFPMLTGLFGISTLLFSLKSINGFPKQETFKKINVKPLKGFLSVLLGTLSGFITAFLPGLGASTAAAISSSLKDDSEPREFLMMIGSISTVNFFMSIAALNVLGKARNGAILAVLELSPEPNILVLIASCVISGGIAVLIALKVSKIFCRLIEKVNYEILAKSVILLLFILTIVLSGLNGLLILATATIIGYYANWKGLPRNSMMACIMVPVMSYFLFT